MKMKDNDSINDFHPTDKAAFSPENDLNSNGSAMPALSPIHCLPFSGATFSLRFLESGTLPPFRGPSLRGGFGFMLKETVCPTQDKPCAECILRPSCVYSCVFEGVAPLDRTIMRRYPYVPQPFILLLPAQEPTSVLSGQSYSFGFRFFGRAAEHFPFIVFSLMELGRHGLGSERIQYILERVTQPGRSDVVFEQGATRVNPLVLQTALPSYEDLYTDRICIDFETPVKLRVAGEDTHNMDFSLLLRSAIRRLVILTHFYGTPIEEALDLPLLLEQSKRIKTKLNETRWREFQRYSGRQQCSLRLGGLIGRMCFTGPLTPFAQVLRLMELAHIGKATSFGFGRISVSPLV